MAEEWVILRASGSVDIPASAAAGGDVTAVGTNPLGDQSDATHVSGYGDFAQPSPYGRDNWRTTIGIEPLVGTPNPTEVPWLYLRIGAEWLPGEPTVGYTVEGEFMLATSPGEFNHGDHIAVFGNYEFGNYFNDELDVSRWGFSLAGTQLTNTVYQFDIPLNLSMFPAYTLADCLAALQAEAYLDINRFTRADGIGNPRLYVYDAWVEVLAEPAPLHAPVTRLYPRDDGRGLSSAPRIHPPTKAGRIVGGYQ